ncbi:39S ribosomal protein L45, mitochondrial-like [Dendronephthya gigantea]|uniref:39S ribosomal protein L45, mitochondrial-like n=1 Tax=Dendronephthya gigantea TaxID=151771 RepID=UPI00106C905D|nr:39S ribosomal protein L45, mitochondrial-like [Dendronephthya gigantea]
MAAIAPLRFVQNRKLLVLLQNYVDVAVQCCHFHTSNIPTYPRKNSPFLSELNEPSFDGSATVPRRRSIPDSLYQKPDIPEQLMKYNEYRDRIVVDSPGGMLSTYAPITKKSSIFTIEGWKQRWKSFKDGIISTYSIGIIKRSVKPFKVREFAKEAENTFIDVNTCLANGDKTGLQEKTSLTAYYGFVKEFFDAKKKFHWHFVSSVERPRIVHAAVSSLEVKENLFAQVVVRLNIDQISAVEDRNGRIITGDKNKPREILEFVVLERHLANEHGSWKICGKLYPRH